MLKIGVGGQPNADIADKGGTGGKPVAENHWQRGERGGVKTPPNMADIICEQSLKKTLKFW